jgi:DNA-binding SARP family transcriptional activator/TolB-like protein/Tfp pilus assembly protein PilF
VSVRIQLLGAFGLHNGGERVVLPARKTEALLAVLAFRPGVASGREALCALLWPDVPEAQARTSLRQALGHLRRALPEGALAGNGDQVHLAPNAASVDTAEAESLLARPPLERAELSEVWQGPLLDGFAAVSEPFAEWLENERARSTSRLLSRMEECVAALSAARQLPRALSVAQWLVDFEPTRESAQRALMRLHAEQGDRASALRVFERCRSVLAQRWSIEPSPETLRLRDEIAVPSAAPFDPSAIGRGPDHSRRWPLAILPFTATPPEGSVKLLADALSEDVTTELARFPELALLSRDSVAALAAQGLAPEDLAREVGARLVLTGTVRGAGDRARVSAALIDATTRLEVWAQKWEVSAGDVFGALERLTRSVVGALALRIDDARLDRARRRPFESLEAYECWLRGNDLLRRGSPQDDETARAFFERALELAPDFARAYAGISLSHFNDWSCQAWERWDLREGLAFENAQRAVKLDQDDAVSQFILGRIQLYRREFDRAHHHLSRAVALNPNDALVLLQAAGGFAQLGEPERAVELADTAFWLNPVCPDWAYTIAGVARLLAGQPAEAAQLIARAPDSFVDTRAHLAIAYLKAGDTAQAAHHGAQYLKQFKAKITPGQGAAETDPISWFFHVNPLRRADDERMLRTSLEQLQLGG